MYHLGLAKTGLNSEVVLIVGGHTREILHRLNIVGFIQTSLYRAIQQPRFSRSGFVIRISCVVNAYQRVKISAK